MDDGRTDTLPFHIHIDTELEKCLLDHEGFLLYLFRRDEIFVHYFIQEFRAREIPRSEVECLLLMLTLYDLSIRSFYRDLLACEARKCRTEETFSLWFVFFVLSFSLFLQSLETTLEVFRFFLIGTIYLSFLRGDIILIVITRKDGFSHTRERWHRLTDFREKCAVRYTKREVERCEKGDDKREKCARIPEKSSERSVYVEISYINLRIPAYERGDSDVEEEYPDEARHSPACLLHEDHRSESDEDRCRDIAVVFTEK